MISIATSFVKTKLTFSKLYSTIAPMTRLTLQNRITTFMIYFTLLLISAFTAIQLYNQLQTITTHNHFRARLSSIIAKTNLDDTLKGLASRDQQEESLQNALNSLSDANIIDEASIYDTKGTVVASTDRTIIYKQCDPRDLKCINDALAAIQKRKWFVPLIDKRKIILFIPLSSDKDYVYVASLSFSLGNMSDALRQVYVPCLLTAFVVIILNTGLGFFLAKTVIGPIRIIDTATEIIAEGDLQHRVNLKTGDELEDLSDRFNHMTQALVKMKEKAENANPLTKLPGNTVIREEIETRIQQARKFVAIYADLDNFKAFNDKYGLAKGDDAIKITGQILKEALQYKGNPDDFLGHEGGDDFFILTTPDKADAVSDYVIKEFGKKIKDLYDQEDLQKGYIEAVSRQGALMKFPVMTISLAGVTNQFKEISGYAEVTNITAEVKHKAKSVGGSVFILDKRID